MIAFIHIECDTLDELLIHMQVSKEQINKKARELKIKKDGFFDCVTIEDSNCYGDHTISIVNPK